MKRLMFVLLLAAAATPALAHDQWLEVEPFRAPAAARAKLYLRVGEHLTESEAVPVRDRERYPRFELLAGDTRKDLRAQIHEDGDPFAALGELEASGTQLIALDSGPRDIQLAAEKFQAYLLEERLIQILALRAERNAEDTPGRERYTRYLKAIVQIGSKLRDHVTRPVGQELEIVPAANPYGVAVGKTLTVQVLFRGKPLARASVTAANRWRKDVKVQHIRTDARGQATFKIDRVGDWMFGLVHMEASNQAGVDWLSWWGNLTFSLGE